MSNPLLSVITVSYNSAASIGHTLNSLRQQTCADYESIVIDGKSTDGTIDIIESNRDVVQHFISERDKGIYDAMNKGIELANGTYVSFLNSDDRYLPHTVQSISELKKESDIIYGDMIKERNLNSTDLKRLEKPDISKMKSTMSIFHPSTFIKKSLFDRFGKYSLQYKLSADYHWLLRAYLSDVDFIYLNKPLSVFTVGGVSNFSCESYREAALIQKDLKLAHEAMEDLYIACQKKMRKNRLVSRLARLPVFKGIYENRVKKNWS